MSSNAYWSTEFTDGILKGRILFKKGECDHCHEQARLVLVQDVNLPNGLDPTDKFILFRTVEKGRKVGLVSPVGVIGITCGCYGKAMRQLAYVIGIRKGKGKS